ncbi:F149A protein, partial [Crypturellus soui]|nr:F149A protein [Crypturellus soui]
ETLSSPSRGHTTPTDLKNSWSGIKSYSSGLSTERSSLYSWRDDEFDKANTQRVHQLFWDIDEMLFEGKVTSQTVSLQAECADWVEQFLHLRVLGKQLLLPKDEGFQYFQSRSDSSVAAKVLPGLHEYTTDIKELCISGYKLVPAESPVHNSVDSSSARVSDPSTYLFLEEEIYDVDGKIEEYLAFDNKELDDESLEQKKMHLAEKSKCGIPPVSPNACIKDAVTSEVFDHIWSNVIEILEELIKKNWETNIPESDKQVEKRKAVTAKLSHLSVACVTAGAGTVPLSRSSEARSGSYAPHFISSQVHRFTSHFCSDLNGVMTIQAKPLQQRHVTMAEKIRNEQEKLHSSGSNVTNSVCTKLGRIADKRLLSSSRVQLASSRKLPSHCRLPSLTSDQLSSKAPNMYNDEILRGTKLIASLDRLSSAHAQTTQNRLPPINSEAVEHDLSVPQLQWSSHQEHYVYSRVSSAVPGSSAQQPLRERTVTVNQFSRPNTTHTFRADIHQKKTLNPIDFVNHTWVRQGFLTGSQHYYKSFQRNPATLRKRFQIAS